jgi:hypothetical protein
MKARYAVYFAPSTTSPWWAFGASWLGRDECHNMRLAQPEIAHITQAAFEQATEEPRRYGFHATLKAPFHLKDNMGLNELEMRLNTLAAQLQPVELGALSAVSMNDFVALLPQAMSVRLSALAEKCVTELDDLRAPLAPLDLARRGVDPKDSRGQFLLNNYGYPHVLERFILHFTLSGSVSPQVADLLVRAVMNPISHLNQSAPLVLDRLCLFVEEKQGQPFKRIADMVLTG